MHPQGDLVAHSPGWQEHGRFLPCQVRHPRAEFIRGRILAFLFISPHHRAPRLNEITAYLGSAPSTASELIKRLQNKGLVVRNRAKRDERTIEIELTEAGRVALAEHTTLDPRKLRDGLKALDDFEQDALVKSIREITEAID